MESFDPAALASGLSCSLYVHVPFCRSKCPYCDFYSVPCPPAAGHRQEMEKVVDRTIEELSFFMDRLRPSAVPTVYIGGGTPSVLSTRSLEILLTGVRRFAPAPAEWTIEANPESLTPEYLQVCRETGVDRLSLGLQSMADAALDTLGRPGDAEANRQALELLRTGWAARLSLDFLVGIPGQTLGELSRDLEAGMRSGAGHLSLYSLTPQTDTPAGSALARNIDQDLQDELWLSGYQRLEAGGYSNYEVANFALPGEECLHNLRYWRLEPYLGVGPGAVSTLAGKGGEVLRLYNPEDLESFRVGFPGGWGLRQEKITPREFLFETLMLGFRMRAGIRREFFHERFGRDLPELVPSLWARWQELGYVQNGDDRYALTDAARLTLNRRLLEMQETLESVDIRAVSYPSSP